MDRMGMTAAQFDAWLPKLLLPHDPEVMVDVLTLDGDVVGQVQLLEGQVNVDADAPVTQSLPARVLDEDGHLEGLAMNRQLRVTYTAQGRSCEVFTGPVIRPVNHDRDEVTLECQDRSAIAMRGVPPDEARGNVVDAIKQILTEKCGETRFDFPTGNKERLEDPITVGWEPEVVPWVQCQQAAQSIDMQLFYRGGVCVLRDFPSQPCMDLTDFVTNRQPAEAPTEIFNRFKVVGKRPKDHTAVLLLDPTHEASAEYNQVGSVRQFFTVEETNPKLNTPAKVLKRAKRLRAAHQRSLAERRGYDIVPVPNLHPLDIVTVSPDDVTLRRWAFPLTASGDMAIGYTEPLGRR